ncbi:hypothetical protein CEXT_798941, partial [Caerostris extrusa]
ALPMLVADAREGFQLCHVHVDMPTLKQPKGQ